MQTLHDFEERAALLRQLEALEGLMRVLAIQDERLREEQRLRALPMLEALRLRRAS